MWYKNAFLFTLFCLYEGFGRAELCYPSMDPLYVCSSIIDNVVKICLIKIDNGHEGYNNFHTL